MTVSNFWGFFSNNHFLEGGFIFQWGASFLSQGGIPWGHQLWWGGLKKTWDWGWGEGRHIPCHPHYGKPCPVNTKIHHKRNHKRNIIWLKTPFSKNVSTKIGKYFLNLLDKHFPKNHHLHRFSNRNSIKVNNSCTKSMKTIINNHNKNILGNKPSLNT